MQKRIKIVIMGAAGRDFHNFNIYFKKKPKFQVICFTAAQIPGIEHRLYPPELSGPLYPDGIPIRPEDELPSIIKRNEIDIVVLAYSDLSNDEVLQKASLIEAIGPSFMLMGPRDTMLKAHKPVVSVCGVRTGVGKSTVARRVSSILHAKGIKVVVIRHPMPYGDLLNQATQRFTSYSDLERYECSIEEREEYEPHLEMGSIIYSGVDYERILTQAQEEADILLWDGGNNDFPFIRPDLHIVVADPLRPGHESSYYPSEINVRMANIIVINKVETAPRENVDRVKQNIRRINPEATIIEASSSISVDDPSLIKNRRVLVIEDGPTVTHGQLRDSVGAMAAREFGAKELVNPRPYAVGSIKSVFESYPHIGPVLPAVGYTAKQIAELEATIRNTECETVILGTPIDIKRLIRVEKPVVRVRYEIKELTRPGLEGLLRKIGSYRIES
jgi:predicted GTPase